MLRSDPEVLQLLSQLDAAYVRLAENVAAVEARDAELRARNARVSGFIDVVTAHAKTVLAASGRKPRKALKAAAAAAAAAAAESVRADAEAMPPPLPVAARTLRKSRAAAAASRKRKKPLVTGGARAAAAAGEAAAPTTTGVVVSKRVIHKSATHRAINIERLRARLPPRYAANDDVGAVLRFMHERGAERTTLPAIVGAIGSTAMQVRNLCKRCLLSRRHS